MNARILAAFALILVLASPSLPQSFKKKRPLPYEFGRVVLGSGSTRTGLAPVVFEHWFHRARFSCRVCHVDIGFAMKTGETAIKAADNMRGYYCGACHNGKMLSEGRPVFEACSKNATADDAARCERCHSSGKPLKLENEFAQFARPFPKERFGNGLDWQQAEELGIIQPADFVKGLSIKRKSLSIQQDFALDAKLAGMPDIIFSHKKHTVWNGCELCHPEIFMGVKKGASRYTMVSIFEGKSCGACHNTVAFPLMDCQRCHSTPPVQR
ncbi:MAG TPA: c(7)-type cytochrome triheme domain-containing protein [Clostridia bacterium]|nr:c(7)-type cytochrome triheme domain-containing protein [Clostridia bacterium]